MKNKNEFIDDDFHPVNEDVIVSVQHLRMFFNVSTGGFRSKALKAVNNVSFDIKRGETLGLVGESGCGKTTCGRSILQLYKPTTGKIFFNGKEISNKKDLKEFRKQTNIVFQDPYSSLDPRMKVADIIAEPLDINHGYKTKAERQQKVEDLMKRVGLNAEQSMRYAHEFSGGQRQRIGIARALALNPEFIVCDEPVSALDVSIQAQVLNTFKELQKEFNLTYLFVAHNLLVVKHISDRIAVMYLGRLVELAPSSEIFDDPLHPYTYTLLSAIPVPDPEVARENQRVVLQGDIPSPLNAPSGCPFRTRCPFATKQCAESMPELKEEKPGHFVACHYPGIAKREVEKALGEITIEKGD
ncbi:MAG: oligopeptide/dipeptide ABC transporter ATP-binding protein [Bacilli bacterium]